MSFSTEFMAKTTEAAKARLRREYLPPTVLAFLLTGHKTAISAAKVGCIGHPCSDETKRRISESQNTRWARLLVE